MDKKRSTNPRRPEPKDERREGYKLAITMLRELEASTDLCDLCALDEFTTGRPTPQDNIVLRYLEKSRGRSPNAESGFCAVLSDFLSDCSEGLVPNAGTYQNGLKIRMPARIKIEPAVDNMRTWKAMQRITGRSDPMPADFGTPGWAKKQRDARK